MNRNLSPDEFADIPEVVQQVADMHALKQGRGSARIVPHYGGVSYTIFGPNHVIQENVDAELDSGDLEGAAREAAYRPSLTMSRGSILDDGFDPPESIIMGFGGIDVREEATGHPPGEGWAEEVATPEGAEGDATKRVAEEVYRTWRTED